MKLKWENVLFYYHPLFLKHLENVSHPESPDRLRSILSNLQEKNIYKHLEVREPVASDISWIEKIHPPEYIKNIEDSCGQEPRYLDSGDTIVTEKSYQAALLAAGSVLDSIDSLLNDSEAKHAFCAVRPPGHHAERRTAMGFCLFNNVAIGAQYVISRYGFKRVFILDWDVHHGNGTQHIFEDRSDVFYCSLHQWPLYPGTGRKEEIGSAAGTGYTLNVPLPPGTGHTAYLNSFTKIVLPALKNYQPELILISCGFDGHKDDPLANLQLTEETFSVLTRLVVEYAKNTRTKKIISVLEGGYNLQKLAISVEIHIKQLALC
jgi:acetoin utilization deacetylase AcuC-like enzyme